MVQNVEAVYENGVLRPLQPLHLKEAAKVFVSVSLEPADLRSATVDHQFVSYARAEVAAMTMVPTLEEAQEQLFTIEGSMSEVIISERGDY